MDEIGKRLWQTRDISIDTKVRLLKTTVWPAATYGCEGWTLNKSDETRIDRSYGCRGQQDKPMNGFWKKLE